MIFGSGEQHQHLTEPYVYKAFRNSPNYREFRIIKVCSVSLLLNVKSSHPGYLCACVEHPHQVVTKKNQTVETPPDSRLELKLGSTFRDKMLPSTEPEKHCEERAQTDRLTTYCHDHPCMKTPKPQIKSKKDYQAATSEM